MALAWLGLWAGGSCGAAPRVRERPVVTTRGAALVPAAAGGLELRVDVVAVNPNDVALRGVAADWELSIDDTVRARGRDELDLALPARGRAETTLVARVKPGAAARILTDRAAGADAALRVDGVIHWQSSAGDAATPFAWDGAAAARRRVSPTACAGR